MSQFSFSPSIHQTALALDFMFYISFQQTFPSSTQQVTIPCEHKWNGIRISQRRGWSKSNDKKCRLDLNWLCYPWKSIFYSFMFLKCICFMYKNSNHSTGTICFSFSLLNCLCKWEFHVSATDAIDCDDVGGETRVFTPSSTEQPHNAQRRLLLGPMSAFTVTNLLRQNAQQAFKHNK